MKKAIWPFLLILLVIGIFYLRFTFPNFFGDRNLSNEKVGLSEGYIWMIVGVLFVIIFLIVTVFLKKYV